MKMPPMILSERLPELFVLLDEGHGPGSAGDP